MDATIPLMILDQIGRHCPRAMGTYALCLARTQEFNKLVLSKKQIRDDLSESYTKFKNDLKALAREGLLEWHEEGDFLTVIVGELCVD